MDPKTPGYTLGCVKVVVGDSRENVQNPSPKDAPCTSESSPLSERSSSENSIERISCSVMEISDQTKTEWPKFRAKAERK